MPLPCFPITQPAHDLLQVDDGGAEEASTAEGKPSEGAAELSMQQRLPAEEPPLGVPDDAAFEFLERRKLAQQLSVLSADHLQVGG